MRELLLMGKLEVGVATPAEESARIVEGEAVMAARANFLDVFEVRLSYGMRTTLIG